MEMITALPQRYAPILDQDAIRNALEKASKLNGKARVCRPLDKPRAGDASSDLRRFDMEVDLAPADDGDGFDDDGDLDAIPVYEVDDLDEFDN